MIPLIRSLATRLTAAAKTTTTTTTTTACRKLDTDRIKNNYDDVRKLAKTIIVKTILPRIIIILLLFCEEILKRENSFVRSYVRSISIV